MKPVYIETRQKQGADTQPSFFLKLLADMKTQQLKEGLSLPKPRVLKDERQRTKSKKRKISNSKSKEKTKTAGTTLKKKKKRTDTKKFVKETDAETDKVLIEIKEQLGCYQDKMKGKEIYEKKEKIVKLATELAVLTKERNNARLSYDTERMKRKEEKGRLNENLLASCKLAGQIEVNINEFNLSITSLKVECEETLARLKEKEAVFNEANQINIVLEGEMTRAGSPVIQQYEQSYFKDSSTRILEMIEFEQNKEKSLESKLTDKNNKISEIRQRIESLKNEIQEVV